MITDSYSLAHPKPVVNTDCTIVAANSWLLYEIDGWPELYLNDKNNISGNWSHMVNLLIFLNI